METSAVPFSSVKGHWLVAELQQKCKPSLIPFYVTILGDL